MSPSDPPADAPDLDALLEDNLDRLRAYIRLRTNRSVRARESHSDLVQSVCREVLHGADRFDFQGDAAFRNWLYKTALRKIIERDRHWKADKRDIGREQSPAGEEADGLFDAYATVSTPSVMMSRKENMAALEAAFDELTDEHRDIITRIKVVGMTHADVAAETGKTEEASRQLLRRALIKLQLVLESRGLRGPENT